MMNITSASLVLLFHNLVIEQVEHFTVKETFLQCARSCVHEHRCRTVFYQAETKQCFAHEAVLSREDIKLVKRPGYKCYMRVLSCKDLPQSCIDVKNANPEAGEGEYRIHPEAKQFHGSAARIYCVMSACPPEEYVTLNIGNYAVFPNQLSNYWGCATSTTFVSGNDVEKKTGRTTFKKIRVLPKTMSIVRDDTRFCETKRDNSCLYGKSEDCYSKSCGAIGVFKSNLNGTGMRLNRHLQWRKFGSYAHEPDINWYHNDLEVQVKCGGKCGGCDVVGQMLLYPQ